MAKFEEHCRDCEELLGKRYEEINRWMDAKFALYGPYHRKERHHWTGVLEALALFRVEGAKAAIVHIVRDCGAVPNLGDYYKHNLGIVIAPEYLMYDGANVTAREKFKTAVKIDWEKLNAKITNQ